MQDILGVYEDPPGYRVGICNAYRRALDLPRRTVAGRTSEATSRAVQEADAGSHSQPIRNLAAPGSASRTGGLEREGPCSARTTYRDGERLLV